MLDANLAKDGRNASTVPSFTSWCPMSPPRSAACEAQGAKILDPPHLIAKMPDHELWMGFFEDSEGNTLSLMAEVRA